MAFDAGTIIAHMDLDLDAFNRKLKDAEDRADKAADKDRKIKISAVFDNADVAKARTAFANLDNMLSRDAMNRLRSSPQGSILGSLNALFSPHQVAGAPTPQQAATQGMLGKTVQDVTGGGTAGGSSIIKGTPTQQASNSQQGSGFLTRVLGTTVGSKLGNIGSGGGGGGGGFGKLVSDFFSSHGGTGSSGFGGGLAGGIGPGILGVSPKLASILSGGGALLGALPGIGAPLAALGSLGAGVGTLALGAKSLIGSQQNPGELYKQAQTAGNALTSGLQAGVAPLAPILKQVFGQIPAIMKQIEPALKALFSGAGTLAMPLIASLVPLVKQILPELGQMFRVTAPLVKPLIDGLGGLVTGLLPGLITLIKAAAPAVTIFGQILSTIGRDLGGMLADFAPVAKAGGEIFQALMDLVGALLPLIGHLAAIFASALAPAVLAISSVFKSLLPVLIPIGGLIGALAQAVLGDLVSALGAAAQLLKDISPALGILFGALKQVFNVLENSGAFATLGDALEMIVPLLANFINQMVRALAPALPSLIQALAQLSNIMIQLLAAGLTTILELVTPLVVSVLKLGVAIIGWLNDMHLLMPVLAIALIAILALNAPITGVIVAVLAIVGAVTELVTHWSTVWGVIKGIAEDAWNFIWNGFGKFLLPLLGPAGLIALGVIELAQHWSTVWGDIKGAALDGWNFIYGIGQDIYHLFTSDIPSWFNTAWRAVGQAWNNIENAVEAPVRFVIDHVLDGLISAFDWITSHIGLGSPIAQVHPGGLAGGGKIMEGTTSTADDVLARVSRGETVVSADHSSILAPIFSAMGIPGYATGGVPAGLGLQRATTKTGSSSGLLGRLSDLPRIIAAIASGNETALINAIEGLIGAGGSGGATKELATILTAVPKALLKDVAKWIFSRAGGLGGSGSAIVQYAESFIGKVPYVWGGTTPSGWDCSGFVEWVYRHFGINPPRTSEEQWSWVRHVPAPVEGGLAFFAGADGTQANPGHVGIVVNPSTMVDAYGTGFGTILNKIQGSSGAISGYGVPPGGVPSPQGGQVLGAGADVVQWLKMAMATVGAPASWLVPMEILTQKESGGSPTAVDPISVDGQHAEGLDQMLPSTYAAYATLPGGIFNPVSNAAAAMRYIMSRYGSPFNIPGLLSGTYHGYDSGGLLPTGPSLVYNGTGAPETVMTSSQMDDQTAYMAAICDRLDALIEAVNRSAPATGAALGRTLNGAARAAVNGALY